MLRVYKSDMNQNVDAAGPGEFPVLTIGPLRVWPPVVLAPMAGVTNYPFRSVCRRFGAGLYVSEMISARALGENREKTLRLADFGPGESPRSLQLYGVDPGRVSEAVRRLVGEGRIDHLDMNFGCPVRKVTRRGGGAALPLRPKLLARIIGAASAAAGPVPVTVKFRLGIDEEHLTYLQSGRIAQEEGCAAVGLHARTAADLYSGEARWEAIGTLKSVLEIPVLGNGDVWEAWDALRMIRKTGCDGVIVGRGCLGRPWLFGDLADVFDGREPSNPPDFGRVIEIMFDHARLLVDWFGDASAIPSFRRHLGWYTKGFRLSSEIRDGMMRARTLSEIEDIFAGADPLQPFPPSAMRVRRGKRSHRQRVLLPEGYLNEAEETAPPELEPEELVSGG